MAERRSFIRHVFKSLYYTNLYYINFMNLNITVEGLLLDVSSGGCKFKLIQPPVKETRLIHDFEGYVNESIVIQEYKSKEPKVPAIINCQGVVRWVNKDMAGIMFNERITLDIK